MALTVQTAVVQSKQPSPSTRVPLAVSRSQPVPELPTPYHVLVRVRAVGLNPTDFKMITHFFMEGNTIGCDFCGVVEFAGPSALYGPGTRICGADFPYRPNNPYNGAFSEYAVCDSRLALAVPEDWSDTRAAALGAIGWGTACLAISPADALGLPGRPSKPAEKPLPVLVYGGATATGIITIQMLKQSGYAPIAVCSPKSAPQVISYGAVGTAAYTSKSCLEDIKKLAGGVPIKHALDCITDPESVATCFGALSRVGGRYACLEDCPQGWRTRPSVKVKVVMGFEAQGVDVDLGHPVYTRKANMDLHALASEWRAEMQSLLDQGLITTQPVRECGEGFEAVIKAVEILQRGESKGQKLVVTISRS
ncbi:chaperonin 10-like protein [Thermothelomyces heterothallicus CBS 202.75]|uniref:chaperonin 10-like protein n=1 Tax=Thermothelomyces heterothallicus CBS 202.75 TaxID=1149848 RepID=UPI0037435F3D